MNLPDVALSSYGTLVSPEDVMFPIWPPKHDKLHAPGGISIIVNSRRMASKHALHGTGAPAIIMTALQYTVEAERAVAIRTDIIMPATAKHSHAAWITCNFVFSLLRLSKEG